MNGRHFRTLVWLRWRLMSNQWRRAGAVNAALMMIVTVGLVITVIPLFIGCYLLGTYAIPRAAPAHLMYAWDAILLGFLFFWSIGLLTELQRTETLSLSKLMHLPISVNGAFVINYLSSLARLSLLLFAPAMLGFSAALISVKGAAMLPVLPLLAAFVLMVTALTYQFQGWLASLMSNPRRRRTVIVIATGSFVLLAQLPNLMNVFAPWRQQRRGDRPAAQSEELAKLTRDFQAKEFDAAEYMRRQQEVVERDRLAAKQASREAAERRERAIRLVNLALPVGWLPLGVGDAAEGRVLPAVLGTLGMTLIGAASLWRAYRTTIDQYQGQPTGREARRAPAAEPAASTQGPRDMLIEARLPGLSEPVSAIALGGFRSLLRAPEAKMMLLTPVLMLPIIGMMALRGSHDIPEAARPLIAIGGMLFLLFGLVQLMGNQFGFDRDGFRVFVLCAAHRRDILLGKNLAFAPLVLLMGALVLPIVQYVYPMRIDHLLAMLPQYVSMFLLFCILANTLSIFTPVRVAAGAMKASSPKMSTALLQLAIFMLLFPLTQGLTLLPLGAEALSRFLGWTERAPVYLLLSLAESALVLLLYRLSLGWFGAALQAREQAILECVTDRAA